MESYQVMMNDPQYWETSICREEEDTYNEYLNLSSTSSVLRKFEKKDDEDSNTSLNYHQPNLQTIEPNMRNDSDIQCATMKGGAIIGVSENEGGSQHTNRLFTP